MPTLPQFIGQFLFGNVTITNNFGKRLESHNSFACRVDMFLPCFFHELVDKSRVVASGWRPCQSFKSLAAPSTPVPLHPDLPSVSAVQRSVPPR